MEFWNDAFTDESWKVLLEIRGKLDFILIGGWACYLLTKAIKSKDIDIIIDYETLYSLRRHYAVKNTPFLKKYEVVMGNTSVDIYLPHYSVLAVPVDKIMRHVATVEGFRIPEPEVLLLLKQGAEIERSASAKGQKDRVDIINLLINANVDMEKYMKLANEFGLAEYPRRLKGIVASARKEFEYLGIMDLRKVKLIKKGIMGRLR